MLYKVDKMNNEEITFLLCPVSNEIKLELLQQYNNIEGIWNKIYGNDNTKRLNKIKSYYNSDYVRDMKRYIDEIGAKVTWFNEEKYPKQLYNLKNPPPILFYKGDIEILEYTTTVAIVGSRTCTSYGEDFTKMLLNYLSDFHVNLISGGARGIDTICHSYSLRYNLKTTLVLGCGIDVVYPKENYNLFKNIEKEGLILTEFLPNTKPYSHNFPTRNRIISCLSQGVIAIEAGDKSGTLITARNALDLGKPVFALQDSFFSKTSKGCNMLLNEGAMPIISLNDIEQGFGLVRKEKVKNARDRNKNKLFNIISDNPIYIDDLIRTANIDITTLYELLFELQLENSIICLSGNYYTRNI